MLFIYYHHYIKIITITIITYACVERTCVTVTEHILIVQSAVWLTHSALNLPLIAHHVAECARIWAY